MMNDILRDIEKTQLKEHKVKFNPGDTLKVHVRIKEGDKERIQVFQGTVIGRRGSGVGETFTVRKISAGIGVERIFPLHSPNVVKIERLREGAVRRAKLYYLRGLSGKSARITEKKRELLAATDELSLSAAAAAAESVETSEEVVEVVEDVTPEPLQKTK
jgi:large subunit ribosomal protein L19